jgi:NAD(P)-dependent dehydrogenase (short-subunit alcohol dehydrogenase family)
MAALSPPTGRCLTNCERLGRPDELMALYVYLASEAFSYMTGSDIVIDVGYTCI